MSKLRDSSSQIWLKIQGSLFQWLQEELGSLTEKQQKLATTLEIVHIEEFICPNHGFSRRPPQNRMVIARVFVEKTIYNMPTTRTLLDQFETDSGLRRICDWERKNAAHRCIILNVQVFLTWLGRTQINQGVFVNRHKCHIISIIVVRLNLMATSRLLLII